MTAAQDPQARELADALEAGWMALSASNADAPPRTQDVGQAVVDALVGHGRRMAAARRRRVAREMIDAARRPEAGPHEQIWNRMLNVVLEHF